MRTADVPDGGREHGDPGRGYPGDSGGRSRPRRNPRPDPQRARGVRRHPVAIQYHSAGGERGATRGAARKDGALLRRAADAALSADDRVERRQRRSRPDLRTFLLTLDHMGRDLPPRPATGDSPVKLSEFEAISFDCYGTLIDWEAGLGAVLSPWARDQGVSIGTEELLEGFAQAEARQEVQTPSALYPEILTAAMRSLGASLGVDVTAEQSAR